MSEEKKEITIQFIADELKRIAEGLRSEGPYISSKFPQMHKKTLGQYGDLMFWMAKYIEDLQESYKYLKCRLDMNDIPDVSMITFKNQKGKPLNLFENVVKDQEEAEKKRIKELDS